MNELDIKHFVSKIRMNLDLVAHNAVSVGSIKKIK